MKKIIIKRDSWHYKLAVFPTKYPRMNDTVCSYLIGVLWGMMCLLAATIMVIGLVLGMAEFVSWIFMMVTHSKLLVPDPIIVPFILVVSFVVIGSAVDKLSTMEFESEKCKSGMVWKSIYKAKCLFCTRVEYDREVRPDDSKWL